VEGAGTTTSVVSSSHGTSREGGDVIVFNALALDPSNDPDSLHNSA